MAVKLKQRHFTDTTHNKLVNADGQSLYLMPRQNGYFGVGGGVVGCVGSGC